MENSAEMLKQKNSIVSIALIVANAILVTILSTTGKIANHDPDGIAALFILLFSVTVLFSGFAFTYNGKGYSWAKWIFGILLIISLAFLGLLWYAWQLGKAFKN